MFHSLRTGDYKAAPFPLLHCDSLSKPDTLKNQHLHFAFSERAMTSVLPIVKSYHRAPSKQVHLFSREKHYSEIIFKQ